jgi:hypothetical protein
MHSAGAKGLGDGLLRHDGSIWTWARGRSRSDGQRAQRARGGRVDEAGVARVVDAMHNGRLAVVAVREGGLAVQAAVGARVAAGDHDDGRLRARRDGAAGGSQSASACHGGD